MSLSVLFLDKKSDYKHVEQITLILSLNWH